MAKQDHTKIISGKDLGQLALDDFCPRCFWLERHNGKYPQIFPGIFSTLDSLTKKSVQRSFIKRSRQPDWLPLEDIQSVVDFKQIKVPTEYGDWTLTGTPDDVFQLTDGTFLIADYKTARYSENQDKLLSMYRVQLNAYAYTLPKQGISPISRLALIYCEPSENLDTDTDFKLSFSIHTHEIPLDTSEIPTLLLRAREILDSEYPPLANPSCKGICAWMDQVYQNGDLD